MAQSTSQSICLKHHRPGNSNLPKRNVREVIVLNRFILVYGIYFPFSLRNKGLERIPISAASDGVAWSDGKSHGHII